MDLPDSEDQLDADEVDALLGFDELRREAEAMGIDQQAGLNERTVQYLEKMMRLAVDKTTADPS